MKLFELSGIKSYKGMSGNLIMKMLERTGVLKKLLGKGTYGMAFELGSGEVLKVWAKDPAYESWIDYCTKHQNNPYVLKVQGKVHDFQIKRASSGTPVNMKFVRVEKLDEPKSMKDFGYDDASEWRLKDFLTQATVYMYKELPIDDAGLIKKFKLDEKKSSPEFIKFVRELSVISLDLAKNTKIALDYHKNNFGMRGNQVVLLDPISSDEQPTPINSVLNGFWDGKE
jgi:hypothetical protein